MNMLISVNCWLTALINVVIKKRPLQLLRFLSAGANEANNILN